MTVWLPISVTAGGRNPRDEQAYDAERKCAEMKKQR
jgi:hypothetical protein